MSQPSPLEGGLKCFSRGVLAANSLPRHARLSFTRNGPAVRAEQCCNFTSHSAVNGLDFQPGVDETVLFGPHPCLKSEASGDSIVEFDVAFLQPVGNPLAPCQGGVKRKVKDQCQVRFEIACR